MDIQAVIYAAVLGLWLGVGDKVATWAGKQRGRYVGLLLWALLVATPATVTGFISVQLLLMALPLGCVLPGLVFFTYRFWKQRFP